MIIDITRAMDYDREFQTKEYTPQIVEPLIFQEQQQMYLNATHLNLPVNFQQLLAYRPKIEITNNHIQLSVAL